MRLYYNVPEWEHVYAESSRFQDPGILSTKYFQVVDVL